MARLDHLAHRLADHHFADLDALRVALCRAHAPAHVGIEREPQVLHQHFAFARLGQRRFLDPEIRFAHPAFRPAGEQHALVLHSAAKRARCVSASPNSRANMVKRRKVWLTLSSSLIPMPPCNCIDSWLIWRGASAILIFAAEIARERSRLFSAWSTLEQARHAIDLACSA